MSKVTSNSARRAEPSQRSDHFDAPIPVPVRDPMQREQLG